MKSNFEFLSGSWNELFEVAKSAEVNVHTDPNSTLIKMRLYGELISKYVIKYEGLSEPYRMNQKERMDYLIKEGAITIEIYEILDSLRMIGNKAVHEANYGTLTEAKGLLKKAFYIGAWLKQLYNQWDFELPDYKEPDTVNVNSLYKKSSNEKNTFSTDTIKGPSSLPACNIKRFSNNDTDYGQWLVENRGGFVFNHYGGADASKAMNKLHQANCRFLHRKQDEGKRTTAYPKICAMSLDELEAHVVQLRGTSWVYCKSCIMN